MEWEPEVKEKKNKIAQGEPQLNSFIPKAIKLNVQRSVISFGVS